MLTRFKTVIHPHILPLIFLVLFGLISLYSIFNPGMMQTHDGLWQVQRATAMLDTLKAGQFPARWAFKQDNDYGVPLFNFVYPGPYYLTTPLMLMGIVNITAIKIITILIYLSGGLGMYYLFRRHRFIAVCVAILYLLNPYQFVNIFVRGAIGETMVIGLAPWILASTIELKNRTLRWYDPMIFALALISHNFLGLLLGAMILVYGVFLGSWKKTVLYISLSLGLAAFFLLPMIVERGNLISDATGNFSYIWSDHFIYPWQLIYSKWDYWYSMPGDVQDGMTFQLGFANIAVLLIYLGWYISRFRRFLVSERLIYGYWIIAATLLILAMVPQGRFIWEMFPVLQTMQFPWRLLGLMTVVSGFAAGIILTQRISHHRLSGLVLAVLLVILAVSNTRNYHRPIKTLSGEEFRILNDVFADKTTTASRSEITPRWAPDERYQPLSLRLFSPRLGILDGNAEINSATDNPGDITFQATAENERATAISYRNYYPMWHATIDGKPLVITPTGSGEISIPLTEGVHEYHIYLSNTPSMLIGNILSITSLLIVAILPLVTKKSGKRKN